MDLCVSSAVASPDIGMEKNGLKKRVRKVKTAEKGECHAQVSKLKKPVVKMQFNLEAIFFRSILFGAF